MTGVFRTALLLIVLISFIGCDQITKSVARNELRSSPPTILLQGFIRLEYGENPGAFLSLGSGLPDTLRFFIQTALGIVVVLCLVLLFVFAQRLDYQRLIGFSLVLGGALGNLLDRFFNHGRVIDFIALQIGELQTGIFNLADLLIITGVLVLLLAVKRRNTKIVGPSAGSRVND